MRKRWIWTIAACMSMYCPTLGATTILSSRAVAATSQVDGSGLPSNVEPFNVGSQDADTAVLFIHGFNGGTDNFEDLPGRLAEAGTFAQVMLLPGHGTRPTEFRDTDQDDLLNAVLAEIRRLKQSHKRVVLVGHSMGGTLSLLAAAQEPVDGIVLGAVFLGVTHKWYYGLRPETWSKITAPIFPWIYKGNFYVRTNDKSAMKHSTSYAWIPSKAVVTAGKLAEAANAPSVLSAIQCPVLMIHSKHDGAASPDAAKRAHDALGSHDKEFMWVNRSNHVVFWDYDREAVAEATVGFVENIRESDTDE